MEKLILTSDPTIYANKLMSKRSCITFPSFKSVQNLISRSTTCIHLKTFKFFSSLGRLETHFRRALGHQRASALTDSIYDIQNTNSTTQEVEHQKRVSKKAWKRTKWFSEIIKKLYLISSGEARPQDAQTSETKLHQTEGTSRFVSDASPPCARTSPIT